MVSKMQPPKTNARNYFPVLGKPKRPNWLVIVKSYHRRASRHILRREVDDYDWNTYAQFAGPENVIEEKHYTYDLAEIDYRLLDGRIYTIADAKPVHPAHRAIWESLANLPEIASVHEVGVGGGKLIVNLGKLLGSRVTLGASDIGRGQLALFERRWPAEYRAMGPFLHDITESPLPERARADAVYTVTVLMHIKRRQAYHAALDHLFVSARKYLLFIENWGAHDYLNDIREALRRRVKAGPAHLYVYDSGATVALLVTLMDQDLPGCFSRLESDAQLRHHG